MNEPLSSPRLPTLGRAALCAWFAFSQAACPVGTLRVVDTATAPSPQDSSPGDTDHLHLEDLDPYFTPVVTIDPAELQPGHPVTVTYRGDLASADRLVMQYGFDGWLAVEGGAGFEGASDSSSCSFYFLDTPMTLRDDGGASRVFQATVDLPRGVETLDLLFFALDEAAWIRDDNQGLQYHFSVHFPYLGPYLTWTEQVGPAEGVVVNFATSAPCLGAVTWGETSVPDRVSLGSEYGYIHHVPLTGLEAGRRYYYRVYDNAGHSSGLLSFQVPDDNPTSFKFVVMADIQDNGSSIQAWGRVGDIVAREWSEAAFILLAGDLPCNDTPGSWWRFFNGARDLFAGIPMLPAIGNHDTPTLESNPDSSSFETYFELPASSGTETVYSLGFGSALLLVLNSERPDEFQEDAAQYRWVDSILAENEHQWVFVVWHDPPYNAGRRFFDAQWDTRPMTRLFDGRVDWVFTGHEHLYQRMFPLRYDGELASSGRYGSGKADGVGYVVLPPAGSSSFSGEIVPWDSRWAEYRKYLAFPTPVATEDVVSSEVGFVTVEVSGRSFDLEAWGMGTLDGPLPVHLVDSYSYTK